MEIDKIVIENFKCYEGEFCLSLKDGVNILVGDNEAGKSTIIDAIHLALTGVLGGRYLRNELSPYLFNKRIEEKYIKSLSSGSPHSPPSILIEIYFKDDGSSELAVLKGNGNSKKEDAPGVLYLVELDESYKALYENLISRSVAGIATIPIEYYRVSRKSFARKEINSHLIPVKSSLIDSSCGRNQNGSDLYISRIVRDNLDDSEKIDVSQGHRKMKETFMELPAIDAINKKLSSGVDITDKEVKVSVDLSTQNAWEASLMTLLDDIPFHMIGKGEQSIVKTSLALSHKKAKEANIILIEEPENHLSYSKLNVLLNKISTDLDGKQMVITTHSSFVANKMGLNNLILLNEQRAAKLSDLSVDTEEFFEKLPGYDILRLVLCKKAVLVEGDCDELVFQRAYSDVHEGRLPIQDGIDVISVGTSFLRFLEIAEKTEKKVIVLTDNDGDVEALNKKYSGYLSENKKPNIEIFFEPTVHEYNGAIEKYNNNTLEPELLRANGIKKLAKAIGKKEEDFDSEDGMLLYMKNNKTKCSLSIFKAEENLRYPDYIQRALAAL